MAYTKIIVVHERLEKRVDYVQNEEKTVLETAVDYAMNRDKTETTCFETAVNCDADSVYRDMMATKARWGKTDRLRKGYHLIQSFSPGETTPEQTHAIGVELVRRLLGDRYEAVVTTHLDKDHLHNHIVFNSVSFVDGRMYRDNFRDLFGGDGVGIRGTSDQLCRENGLSVIEPKNAGQNYGQWQAEKLGKFNGRAMVRADIDAILKQSYTLDSFFRLLEQCGYTVKRSPRRKYTAVRPPGGERFFRLDKLNGKLGGYTEADLLRRLEEQRRDPPDWSRPIVPRIRKPVPRRLRGAWQPGRKKKITGFQALCFRYIYLLRGVKKKARRTGRVSFPLRREAERLARYQKQFKYLLNTGISTMGELEAHMAALAGEITQLEQQRRPLYEERRRTNDGSDEYARVSEAIQRHTAALKPLRQELALCRQMQADAPRIAQRRAQAQVEQTQQGKEQNYESKRRSR